jgi:hypothetical protein
MATDSYTHQEYETKGHKMKLSYQNANPYSGHESYYLKFKDTAGTNTNCVLVDSGENVDVKNEFSEESVSKIAFHVRILERLISSEAAPPTSCENGLSEHL